MDSGAFYVLHDSRDQDYFTVADGVNLALFALQVPVDQHRLIGGQLHRRREVMDQLGGVLHDLHGAATKHVARPDHGGIPNVLGHLQSPFHRGHGPARRLRDTQSRQEILELMPVRSHVDGLGAGAEDGQAGHGQRLGKIDGRLAAKLDHGRRRHVVYLFVLQDVPHRFLVQGLEVEPVTGVEVGGHRFRIGVDHDAFHAGL